MSNITPFVDSAVAAVLEIQENIKCMPKDILLKKHSAGAGGDISLEVDLVCEKKFIKYLSAFGTIHSEESGKLDFAHALDDVIILDPLDGSDNFVASIPYFGASIALCDKDKKTKAAVVANYCSSEFFFRDLNYCSGESFVLHNGIVKKYDDIYSQKVGIFESPFKNVLLAQELCKKGFKFRSLGALALSLTYSKRCRFMLYIGRLRMYDIEAGIFISDGLYSYRDEHTLLLAHSEKDFLSIKSLIEKHKYF